MRAALLLVAAIALGASREARADRGAVSVDLGGAASGLLLPAPAPAGYAVTTQTSTPVSSLGVVLGARYALTNQLELSLSGFFDPPVPVYSNGITLTSTTPPISSFPGTLSYQLHRHGALAGARWNWGTVWRLSVGGDLGWAHHCYTALVHLNDGTASNVTDYHLPLRDVATDSALLSVGGGVEWFITDRLSLSLQPRLQLLLGHEPTIGITLPLVVSYSWYL